MFELPIETLYTIIVSFNVNVKEKAVGCDEIHSRLGVEGNTLDIDEGDVCMY